MNINLARLISVTRKKFNKQTSKGASRLSALSLNPTSKKVSSVPYRRDLYALAKEMMSLPCNKNHADKTFVYESQAAYNAYFKELKK